MLTRRRRSVLTVIFFVCALQTFAGCASQEISCWDQYLDGYYKLSDFALQGKLGDVQAAHVRDQLATALRSCKDVSNSHEINPDGVDAHIPGYLTALDIAVLADDAALVRALLKSGASPSGDRGKEKEHVYGALNSLHLASYYESSDAARALLGFSVDPNVRATDGSTPLHYAGSTSPQGLDLIRELVAHGADLNLSTSAGYTPLDSAIAEDNLRKTQCLWVLAGQKGVRAISGENARKIAERRGRTTALKWLDQEKLQPVPVEISKHCSLGT